MLHNICILTDQNVHYAGTIKINIYKDIYGLNLKKKYCFFFSV